MSAPVMRASDQDREEAVLALGDEYAAGRLDHAEFEARMARAQEATYLHELDPLFADLPPRPRRAQPTATVAAPAARGVRRRHRPRGLGLLVPVLAVAAFVLLEWHALWLLLPLWWFGGAMARRRAWERRAAWQQAARDGSWPAWQDGAWQQVAWQHAARHHGRRGHGPSHGGPWQVVDGDEDLFASPPRGQEDRGPR